jgi:glutamate---cysteine ligase / carboxylate-amine ligase
MQFDPAILKALQVSLSEDRKHIVIRSDRRHTNADNFSFGIEEEYFLADAASLEAALRTPDELFEAVNWSTGGQATRELLQAQLEVGTNVHSHATDAFEELKFLRKEVGKIAAQYGFAIMACGTHPTAAWDKSVHSPKLRYTEMMDDLRMLGQRNMLCGMHVHVQLPNPDQRFQIMCDMIPYIPLFIALSTSSPFWHSQETGLKGYRLAAYDELPRTGLPELLCSKEHYDNFVTALVNSGAMPDASYIWWSMRPSMRHPTLELRAPDCCTRVQDAIAISCLYRVLVRHLSLNGSPEITPLDRAIAAENKWRAQRYGVECPFASKDGAISVSDFLDKVLSLTQDDAEALHCAREVALCKSILRNGTSADMQLEAFRNSLPAGLSVALAAAKSWIAKTTQGEDIAGSAALPSSRLAALAPKTSLTSGGAPAATDGP